MRWLLFLALELAAGLMAADPSVLVLQKGASSLAYYSTTGQLEGAVAVGQHPHEMVRSRDGRLLYITDNGTMRIENPGTGGNTVSIVDIAARRKVGEISLGNYRRPHGIDLDSTGQKLVVTTELPDQLLLIDVASRRVIRTFDTKGKTSHMVTLGPGARWAYVSNSSSATVSAVNLETGDVRSIACGARPEGSVLSKDGRFVYVANREGRSITIIDTGTNQAAAAIATGSGPVRIGRTPDGSLLVYAAMHDKAVEIADPVGRKVVGRIPLPAASGIVSLQVSPDGAMAIASAEEDDTVYVVSIPERRLIRTLRMPKGSAPDPALWLAER